MPAASLHRGLGLLYGDDAAGVGSEQHTKGAHAGVGVDEGLFSGQRGPVAHKGDEALGLRGVDLEEGGGCDAELPAGDALPVVRLARFQGDVRALQARLDEPVAGVDAVPD